MTKKDNNDSFTDSFAQAFSEVMSEAVDGVIENSILYVTRVRDVKLPQRAHDEDAGYDFFVPNDFAPYTLLPGNDVLIPSGIKVIVPKGYALVAHNKSGVATKLKLGHGAEVCDEGYAGEVHIHLVNHGSDAVIIKPGMKVIQFLLLEVGKQVVIEIGNDEYEKRMEQYTRGANGFGSTGV